MAFASFDGESGRFAAGDEVFLFLGAVMHAVEESADAENEEIRAKETSEEAFRVQDDNAHDGTTDTAKDPSEAVERVNGGAEAGDDFGEATEESVAGDDVEVPSGTLAGGEEESESDDSVDDGEDHGNGPAGLLTGAVEGVDEF